MLNLILCAIPLGFVGWVIYCYQTATGTVCERLASGFRRSMTIFAAVGAAIMTGFTQLMDLIAQLSGDPQVATSAAAIKSAIPPQYVGLIPFVGFGLVIIARMRTLGK